MSKEEFSEKIKNKTFREAQSNLIFKFIAPDTFNINGLPVSNYKVFQDEEKLFIDSGGVRSEELLVTIVENKYSSFRFELTERHSGRHYATLVEQEP